MGKHQNSVMVVRIWLKFWWMTPMVVKNNHTKSTVAAGNGCREWLGVGVGVGVGLGLGMEWALGLGLV